MRVRTVRRVGTGAAAGLLLAALLPGPGASQQVHGFVFYSHNDFPVALATVSLVRPEGTVVAATETGFDGRFVLVAPEPGEYLVHVEHLTAFAMVDGPVHLEEGGRAILTFSLPPKPLALDAIEVEVERRSLPLARRGFYDRELQTGGYFVDPGEIERRAPIEISDLLRTVPGLRFIENNGMAGFRGYPMMNYALRSQLTASRGPCFPRVYVDGAVVEQGGNHAPFSDFDELVPAGDLVGMEVYRSPAETPAQYAGLTACGVILLWTRQGR